MCSFPPNLQGYWFHWHERKGRALKLAPVDMPGCLESALEKAFQIQQTLGWIVDDRISSAGDDCEKV